MADAPYIETIRSASVFANSTSSLPTGWTALPFASASQILSVAAGLLVAAEGGGLYVGAPPKQAFTPVACGQFTVPRGALLAAETDETQYATTTTIAGIDATGEHAFSLSCKLDTASPSCTVTEPGQKLPRPIGNPSAALITRGGTQLWAGGATGLVVWQLGQSFSSPRRLALDANDDYEGEDAATAGEGVRALAANGTHVAVGTTSKLRLYVSSGGGVAYAAAPRLVRSEWVTDVISARGGPIADAIGALAFDQAGALFINTASSLDVRHADGSFVSYTGRDGLPCANGTALALMPHPLHGYEKKEGRTPDASPGMSPGMVPAASQLWMACANGLALIDVAPGGMPTDMRHTTRYFRGARWLPVAVLTDGGIGTLTQEAWTLARKAEYYDAMIPRHRRHKLIAGLRLPTFGALEGATTTDSDNDGLWTAHVVGAEAMRAATLAREEGAREEAPGAAKGASSDAKALAFSLFEGIELLLNVTHTVGLPARSAVAPGEVHHSSQHDKTKWHNSTSSAYVGWAWKGDTSSDEITGHLFAHPIVRNLATDPGSNARARVEAAQLAIAGGIASNGLTLRDVTGLPTTWGRWDPIALNTWRNFSDERGVNSAQLLSFLVTSNATAAARADARLVKLLGGTAEKVASGPDGYAANAAAPKIVTPCDDNYSDDMLLFLTLYAGLCAAGPPHPIITPALRLALRSAFDAEVGSERSALYGSIFLAGGGARSERERRTVQSDILWSLRTWPLEHLDWPIVNSERWDLTYRRGADRFGRAHGQVERVLPANERRQYRWNADPFDVRDGGDGRGETDPGAWLLAYWMARHHGLLDGQ